ncbi:MAG: hypothetical protein AAGA23_14725 [Pseudomonadota bacterium]
MLRRALALLLVSLAAPLDSLAQTTADNKFLPPCEGDIWWADSDANRSDFDFWVGEWQVFDKASGLLVGFDDISEIRGGCALRQHWRHMNDQYSPPGAPWRMRGGSDTSLAADGRWHQVWIDNNGGYIHLSGGLDENGVMVLQSDWMEYRDRAGTGYKVRHRWHWAPQEDGTIHNWGFQQSELPAQSDWVKYYDIVYRRNVKGGPSAYYKP